MTALLQLLNLLKSFSKNLVDKTRNLEEKMDVLVHKTTETKVRLNNTLNEFLMLANTQFIENRVYDDDDVDHDAIETKAAAKEEEQCRATDTDPEQVKARWKKAVADGLGSLALKVHACARWGLQYYPSFPALVLTFVVFVIPSSFKMMKTRKVARSKSTVTTVSVFHS